MQFDLTGICNAKKKDIDGGGQTHKMLFKSSRYIPFEMDAKKKLARTSMEVGTLTPTGSVQCGPGSDNDNNKKTNFSLSIAHIITLISCLN